MYCSPRKTQEQQTVSWNLLVEKLGNSHARDVCLAFSRPSLDEELLREWCIPNHLLIGVSGGGQGRNCFGHASSVEGGTVGGNPELRWQPLWTSP